MAPLFELDPTSEDATNSPLEIWSTTDYSVTAFSAPAPAFNAQWAGTVDTEGSLIVSRKHDNRTLSLTVDVASVTGLRNLQAKIAKIARESGTAKQTFPNSEVVIWDLLAADTFEPQLDITYYTNTGAFCSVNLSLLAKPYGRGPEITSLPDHAETTLPILVFTETGIKGDIPGLGRLVIDEDQAHDQLTVLWGIQSRYYDATAPLFFQAESGTAVSAVAAAGPAGASGSGNNTMYNSTVPLYSSIPPYDVDFGLGGVHVGSFRVIARVQAPNTNAGTVSVGMYWTAGTSDITFNDTVALDPSAEGNWLLVDLGQVTSKQLPVGTPSLAMAFTSASTVNNDDIYWDWVALIPVDEGWGQVNANPTNGALPLPSSGHLQIADDHVFAQSGTTWGRPGKYEGSYLTIPPAGLESRSVRIIVKGSRGRLIPSSYAFSALSYDSAIDDISAHLNYTPRYLTVPGT